MSGRARFIPRARGTFSRRAPLERGQCGVAVDMKRRNRTEEVSTDSGTSSVVSEGVRSNRSVEGDDNIVTVPACETCQKNLEIKSLKAEIEKFKKELSSERQRADANGNRFTNLCIEGKKLKDENENQIKALAAQNQQLKQENENLQNQISILETEKLMKTEQIAKIKSALDTDGAGNKNDYFINTNIFIEMKKMDVSRGHCVVIRNILISDVTFLTKLRNYLKLDELKTTDSPVSIIII